MSPSANIYSKPELRVISAIQKFKGILLFPILWLLTKIKITANVVSIVSALVALASLIAAYYLNQPAIFIIGIWVHIFLDNVDGSLARYQKKESKSGTTLDVMCDVVGIIAAVIFGWLFSYISLYTALAYIILYIVILINSLILLYWEKHYLFVLRPRFFSYLILTIDYIWQLAYSNLVHWWLAVIMAICAIIGFVQIVVDKKNRMNNKDQKKRIKKAEENQSLDKPGKTV